MNESMLTQWASFKALSKLTLSYCAGLLAGTLVNNKNKFGLKD